MLRFSRGDSVGAEWVQRSRSLAEEQRSIGAAEVVRRGGAEVVQVQEEVKMCRCKGEGGEVVRCRGAEVVRLLGGEVARWRGGEVVRWQAGEVAKCADVPVVLKWFRVDELVSL